MPPEFRVFRSVAEAAGAFAPSAVTIGNFDGVHRGHQQLFRRLVELGAERGGKPSVITFEPHPARVVAPDRAPTLLSTMRQRLGWIEECGIAQALVIPFDLEFSRQSPERFVEHVLVETAGAKAVLIGDNFRFGARQAGDTALLRRMGAKLGFTVEVMSGIGCRGEVISSTRIRSMVVAGRMRAAERLLGRPFSLEGAVVAGHGVGSKQTVPTLNLEPENELLPARGVYVSRVTDPASGRAFPAVTNVGMRPTFGGDALSIESFILEGYSEPAPRRIRVEFLHRLREERKFPDPDSLKQQIIRDVGRAKGYFRRRARFTTCV